MFIGRKEELAELNARFNSGHFEFGVVYGARRIGKSSLLLEFVKGKKAFYFQARRASEEENLRSFTREFNEMRGLNTHYTYDSFESAFDELAEYALQERFVFIIDEIAYLCNRGKGLLSTLQYYIDGKFRDSGMMVILSGSNISFMEELLTNRHDPLYKRATFQMNILKMPFSESREFLTGCSPDDFFRYMAVFGGYPYYLGMLDLNVSFEENLKKLLFSKYGTLVDAPEKVLPSGLSEENMYNSVLIAVSRHKRTNKVIADSAGVDSSYVSAYISSLVKLQVLEKRESFITNKKMNYYEISDNLLRFWYRFVFSNRDAIQLGFGDAVLSQEIEEINDFISRAFEDTVIDYMTEQNRRGRLGALYGPIRNYKVENSRLGRSVELDGLAETIGKNRKLLVIECKYRNAPFSGKMLEHLKESVTVLAPYEGYDYWLFSKSGFTKEIKDNASANIHLISSSDMLG